MDADYELLSSAESGDMVGSIGMTALCDILRGNNVYIFVYSRNLCCEPYLEERRFTRKITTESGKMYFSMRVSLSATPLITILVQYGIVP